MEFTLLPLFCFFSQKVSHSFNKGSEILAMKFTLSYFAFFHEKFLIILIGKWSFGNEIYTFTPIFASFLGKFLIILIRKSNFGNVIYTFTPIVLLSKFSHYFNREVKFYLFFFTAVISWRQCSGPACANNQGIYFFFFLLSCTWNYVCIWFILGK